MEERKISHMHRLLRGNVNFRAEVHFFVSHSTMRPLYNLEPIKCMI